jgi:hypothetical protein
MKKALPSSPLNKGEIVFSVKNWEKNVTVGSRLVLAPRYKIKMDRHFISRGTSHWRLAVQFVTTNNNDFYIKTTRRQNSKSSLCQVIQWLQKGFALVKEGKAVLVTDRGDPKGCDTSRMPYFLGIWLIDGGEAIRITLRPSFTPRNIPGTHFC